MSLPTRCHAGGPDTPAGASCHLAAGEPAAAHQRDKADQVWLFTRNLAVPWTNNASEQALKGPKRHQAVSGYWHTLTTLAAYCRVRSYLVSARGHNIRAIDAIHNALTGNPWLPTPATA